MERELVEEKSVENIVVTESQEKEEEEFGSGNNIKENETLE